MHKIINDSSEESQNEVKADDAKKVVGSNALKSSGISSEIGALKSGILAHGGGSSSEELAVPLDKTYDSPKDQVLTSLGS